MQFSTHCHTATGVDAVILLKLLLLPQQVLPAHKMVQADTLSLY